MKIRSAMLAFPIAAVAGCEALPSDPMAFAAQVDVAYVTAPETARNAAASMSGGEEAPDPVETRARGAAKFQLSQDGQSISYRVNVANIENVLMAHIHRGAPGVPGPVVVWLYPAAPPALLIPGRFQGTLMEGTFTAANLMGPLAGMTIADLWDAIRSGITYVNVHTSANLPGEVRGQIHASGHLE